MQQHLIETANKRKRGVAEYRPGYRLKGPRGFREPRLMGFEGGDSGPGVRTHSGFVRQYKIIYWTELCPNVCEGIGSCNHNSY
jgi:hypothetical protein